VEKSQLVTATYSTQAYIFLAQMGKSSSVITMNSGQLAQLLKLTIPMRSSRLVTMGDIAMARVL